MEWERKVDKLIESGNERKALQIIDAILNENPNLQKALFSKAYIHQLQSEPKEALNAYLQLHSLQGEGSNLEDQIFVLDAIGELYRDMGDFKKAITYYRKEIEIIESNNSILPDVILEERVFKLYDIAKILERMEKYKEAVCYHLKLVEIHREEPFNDTLSDDFLEIGRMYLKLQNYKSAIKYFSKALEIRNERGNTYDKFLLYFFLGKSYYNLKEFKKARKYLRRSIEGFNLI